MKVFETTTESSVKPSDYVVFGLLKGRKSNKEMETLRIYIAGEALSKISYEEKIYVDGYLHGEWGSKDKEYPSHRRVSRFLSPKKIGGSVKTQAEEMIRDVEEQLFSAIKAQKSYEAIVLVGSKRIV